MREPKKGSARIDSQAAAWLARRDAGMSPAEQTAFERWQKADPRHASAVAEVEAMWGALDRPVESGQSEALRGQLRLLAHRQRQRRIAGGTLGLLTAACFALYFWSPQSTSPSPVFSQTARISLPERQVLPDGSIVELKPGASISVAYTARQRTIALDAGEAHFSVAKNPDLPFVVEARGVQIRAVGTAFAVQVSPTDLEVLVTQGQVSVAIPEASPSPMAAASSLPIPARHPPPVLEQGYRAVVSLGSNPAPPSIDRVLSTDLSERLAWRLPRLDFSETTVAEAVALFNEHNTRQLRVGDAAAAELRVTGVFRSDNLEGFVRALEAGLGLRAERHALDIVLFSGN